MSVPIAQQWQQRRRARAAELDLLADPDRTPVPVVWAVTLGVVPAPFLLVYAGLFLVHGLIVEPQEIDVTSSRTGETVAGVIAVLFLAVVLAGLGNLLGGTRRWLFAAGQLITLGGCCYLIADPDSGPATLPAIVAVTSAAAVLLAIRPVTAAWVRASRAAA